MDERRVQRRLAAILMADVVGYSRLMGADEVGTLRRMKALRDDVIEPKVTAFVGRVVKTTGDGFLMEFPSAVNAVQLAIDLQQALAQRNAGESERGKIELRIGVNLGDVIVDGDDIHGDGVNVAARLEGVAEPGGICVSDVVYAGVRKKLAIAFEDLGEQSLKNIADPVRAYQVRASTIAEAEVPEIGALFPLPDKPSIAVLAFANLSNDPEQEYFADGIAEDIITALSRFRSLVVIARKSTFVYKDRSVNVSEVGRKLGARYVLQGSVRRSGNRLRVTAQLVEAQSGNHLWADSYDGQLDDVFALQDEISRSIVATLAIRLEETERVRRDRHDAASFSAYECCLRGKIRLRAGTIEGLMEARDHFQRAIDIDPSYAQAYIDLAETYFAEALSAWTKDPETATQRVFELAREAARLDPLDSRARLALSWAHFAMHSDFELAGTQIEEALRLNPNDYDNHCFKGWLSTCQGELDLAMACSSEALRRSPLVPDDCLMTRLAAAYLAGDYTDAVVAFDRMLRPQPNAFAWVAAAYAQLSRHAEASEKMEAFFEATKPMVHAPARNDEKSWIAYWAMHFPSTDHAAKDHLIDGLRKAGLPV